MRASRIFRPRSGYRYLAVMRVNSRPNAPLVADTLSGASRLLVFYLGLLHKFVGGFSRRIPLDHLPSANLTIDTAAVSNGQFGIADKILGAAVPTIKVTDRGWCWAAHRCIISALVPYVADFGRRMILNTSSQRQRNMILFQ